MCNSMGSANAVLGGLKEEFWHTLSVHTVVASNGDSSTRFKEQTLLCLCGYIGIESAMLLVFHWLY